MSSTTNPGSSDHEPAQLTIVIVTWNVRDYLAGCLRSLESAGVPTWARVVVVDNASEDGTAQMVDRDFRFVRLMTSTSNVGFTRANNLALRNVNSKYVLLLNPDTLVPPGALEKLVAAMDADTSIGAIAPRQHSGSGLVQLEAAVALPTIWNAFCDLALLSKAFPRSRIFCRRTMGWWNHLDDRDVPALAGSAMLLRRTALNEVGLLDEAMFYVEDMDLCRRLARAGWRIRYLGTVAITHFGGASVKRSNVGLYRQIAYQSFWVYLRKHDGPLTATLMTASVFVVSLMGWMGMTIVRSVPLLPHSDKCDTFHEIARALLRWAVLDKNTFSHPLAALPRETDRRIAGAITRTEGRAP